MEEEKKKIKKRRLPLWALLIIAFTILTVGSVVVEAGTTRPFRYYTDDNNTAFTYYTNANGNGSKSLWGINTDNPLCELDINGSVCINSTGIWVNGSQVTGGGVGTNVAFVTVGNDGSLSAERAISAGYGITTTDTGANGLLRINITGLEACGGSNVSVWNGTEWNCVSGGGADGNNYTSGIDFSFNSNNIILNLERVGMINLSTFFTLQANNGINVTNRVFYIDGVTCGSGEYSRFNGSGFSCFADQSGGADGNNYLTSVESNYTTNSWKLLFNRSGLGQLSMDIFYANDTGRVDALIIKDNQFYANITAINSSLATTISGLSALSLNVTTINSSLATTISGLSLLSLNVTNLQTSNTSIWTKIDQFYANITAINSSLATTITGLSQLSANVTSLNNTEVTQRGLIYSNMTAINSSLATTISGLSALSLNVTTINSSLATTITGLTNLTRNVTDLNGNKSGLGTVTCAAGTVAQNITLGVGAPTVQCQTQTGGADGNNFDTSHEFNTTGLTTTLYTNRTGLAQISASFTNGNTTSQIQAATFYSTLYLNITNLQTSNTSVWTNINGLYANLTTINSSLATTITGLTNLTRNVTDINSNKSGTGNCAAGTVEQNDTINGPQCVPLTTFTYSNYFDQNLNTTNSVNFAGATIAATSANGTYPDGRVHAYFFENNLNDENQTINLTAYGTGASYQNGPNGKALFLAALNNTLIQNVSLMNFTDMALPWSITLFAKFNQTPTFNQMLWEEGTSDGTKQRTVYFYYESTVGTIRLGGNGGGGAGCTAFNFDTTKPDTNWHNYAITYTGGTFKVYIDAVQMNGSASYTYGVGCVATTNYTHVASQGTPAAPTNNLLGGIDTIYHYNKTLSQAEITAIQNTTTTGNITLNMICLSGTCITTWNNVSDTTNTYINITNLQTSNTSAWTNINGLYANQTAINSSLATTITGLSQLSANVTSINSSLTTKDNQFYANITAINSSLATTISGLSALSLNVTTINSSLATTITGLTNLTRNVTDINSNKSGIGTVTCAAGTILQNVTLGVNAPTGQCVSTSAGSGNITGSNATANYPAVWTSTSNLAADLINVSYTKGWPTACPVPYVLIGISNGSSTCALVNATNITGVPECNVITEKTLYNTTTGLWSCGTDQNSGSGVTQAQLDNLSYNITIVIQNITNINTTLTTKDNQFYANITAINSSLATTISGLSLLSLNVTNLQTSNTSAWTNINGLYANLTSLNSTEVLQRGLIYANMTAINSSLATTITGLSQLSANVTSINSTLQANLSALNGNKSGLGTVTCAVGTYLQNVTLISNAPTAQCAVDAGTAYTAGGGLNLSVTAFLVDAVTCTGNAVSQYDGDKFVCVTPAGGSGSGNLTGGAGASLYNIAWWSNATMLNGSSTGMTYNTSVLNMNNDTITNVTLFAGALENNLTNNGTPFLNWNDGMYQAITLNQTTTISQMTAPGVFPTRVQLKVLQNSTGLNYGLTFPAGIKWQGGAAPIWTTTLGRADFVACYYDGVSYWCSTSFNFG
jgi:hypothetical protein